MTTSYENYSSEKCNQYDAQGRRAVCIDEILAEMPTNCAVLDAGCGTGNYMVPLVNSGKVDTYTGRTRAIQAPSTHYVSNSIWTWSPRNPHRSVN